MKGKSSGRISNQSKRYYIKGADMDESKYSMKWMSKFILETYQYRCFPFVANSLRHKQSQ